MESKPFAILISVSFPEAKTLNDTIILPCLLAICAFGG
jgi:hypothetical protein